MRLEKLESIQRWSSCKSRVAKSHRRFDDPVSGLTGTPGADESPGENRVVTKLVAGAPLPVAGESF